MANSGVLSLLNMQQNPSGGIFGLQPSDIGVLGAGLHDAMAYFGGKPEGANQLFPAVQQASQMQYARGLLAPITAPSAQPGTMAAGMTSAGQQSGSNAAGYGGTMGALPPMVLPRLGDGVAGASGPQPPTPQQAANTPDYGDLNPQAQSIFKQIPHIPGMPARQALTFYLTDPSAYYTAAAKQYDQTDLQKNTGAAYGTGTPEASAALRGTIAKGATVNMRPGGGAWNMADNSIVTMPNSNGVQTTFPQGANGPAVMGMPQGAPQAMAMSSYATNAGKAATTPDIGYGATGMPVATNNLAMTGAPNVLGLPGQGQAGLAPPLPRLSANGSSTGVSANGLPRIGAGPAANNNSQLMPALPANQAPYMAGQGKDASDRHDQTIQEALGSPDRINVLDNIIKLSQSGVNTGPGSDFYNQIKGYASNTPLGPIFGDSTKSSVAQFQEMQKFLLQNGQRAWQAAGGTGTDAQLEAASHANPNDAQFPQALQTISKWVKAGELGVQAKANAQDRYLQQNGNTASNQISFENNWRNAMDRRVFQLQAMTPQEQQAYVKTLSPSDAATIRTKRQQLQSLGAIQ
jgi:hypothetical protein